MTMHVSMALHRFQAATDDPSLTGCLLRYTVQHLITTYLINAIICN